VGTIQAQIVGHPGHRDPTKLTREMISYRFAAEITKVKAGKMEICLSATTSGSRTNQTLSILCTESLVPNQEQAKL
jgi:hypothetical protein